MIERLGYLSNNAVDDNAVDDDAVDGTSESDESYWSCQGMLQMFVSTVSVAFKLGARCWQFRLGLGSRFGSTLVLLPFKYVVGLGWIGGECGR